MGLAIRYYIKRIFFWFQQSIWVLPSRIMVFLCCTLLLTLPWLGADPYLLRVMGMAAIFALLAASWDLLSGIAGQMNFGQALFFGVGAYAAALLNLHLGFAPWASIPCAGLISILSGLVIGIPCLRLKGAYLSLTTLAFPIILLGLIYYFSDFTGGELGLFGVSSLHRSRVGSYMAIVITMISCAFILWKIADSKIGIIFHAIREDEVAVRANGINTIYYKLLAFSLSAFFGGIAGGLYAHFIRLAGPSTLEILTSFQVVIWGIFGGIATIYGPIAGVFILFPTVEYLRVFPELRTLIFAGMILFTLIYMPEGLTPWLRDRFECFCPRCKLRNFKKRRYCRICTTALS